ncbi:hypothetical protein AB0F15_00580 [Amycolatopsis sp. NPDC026612]|uniref:hypothetical protein n=1 Tax=Amycolatopsis sp. NPDC026612 TaxID=3155466 RepID=UPI0033D6F3FC
MSAVFIRATVDDAFITWRYGRTLVESGVWNFNAEGPLVEGYTNALYAALAIVPALLGIPVEVFFKVISLGILAAYVVVVRRMHLPRRQEFLLLAVTVASPVFLLLLYMGLETVSFALLIAWLFGILYRKGELGTTGFLVAGALASTRPEGIVFAGVAIGWALLIAPKRAAVKGAAAVLGGWAVYWVARSTYFHAFFPNTFYQKTDSNAELASRAVAFLQAFSPVLGVAALVGLAALVLVRYTQPTQERASRLRDAVPLVLALTSAVLVIGVYKQSHLVMDPVHRFAWQVLFPVVLVALSRPLRFGTKQPDETGGEQGSERSGLFGIGVAIATMIAWDPSAAGVGIVLLFCAMAVLSCVIVGLVWRDRGALAVAAAALAVGLGYCQTTEAINWTAYRYRLQYAHEALGGVLSTLDFGKMPPGSIAIVDAGVLPYRLPTRVIDMGGLADATVARNQVTDGYLDKAGLKMVIFGASTPGVEGIWQNGAATRVHDYVTSHGFWSAGGPLFDNGYWLNYYVSPDWATSPEWTGKQVRQAIDAAAKESVSHNSKTDLDIILDNFWNLPFLK